MFGLANHIIFYFLTALSGYHTSDSGIIQAKAIEKNLARVTDSFYIHKFEVSNREYQRFLAHIEDTATESQFKNWQPDSLLWLSHPAGAQYYKHYHGNPLYADYPIVAISYAAATAYCAWLTNQYLADNKRKFKRVRFRLPSEAEWMTAAWGGKGPSMYPWGNYLRHRTGEQMAVFRYIGDSHISYDSISQSYKVVLTTDEILQWNAIPVAVQSFFPNPLGMYHVSGNVAEWVAEPGLTKGGCFNDAGYDIQIQSRKYYPGPSIEVGFRVAMEVLP